ncbi:MAG: histidine kinase [Lentimicrobiaceae bacterium]
MDKSFFTRNLWIYYIAFWMAVAVIQFALSYGVYGQELIIAAADSLVSNLIFAFLGAGLWYMVRFSGKQINGFIKNLAYHLGSCALTILIWQIISYAVLRILFESNDVYMNFLVTSLIVRVLTGVLIYFLLISVDYLVLSFEEMQERAEHEVALSAMLRDAELAMLRSQIRPHFLFNSLNSVSALTLTNPQAAQDMIIKLSEFMRHSLGLGAETMNSLNDELYHAGLYLDIEKVRFSDRMFIEKNIDPACGAMMLPAMILQPLLENAVKHGVNTMLTSCAISLKAACNDLFLNITISNNFDPDAVPRKGTGTGLSNVKKRMAAIYGRNDLLTINSSNEVFEVKLQIPVQRDTLQQT